MAFNSTIKQKIGICALCSDGKEKPLTKKLCSAHYWQSIKLKSAAKQQEKEEVENKIRETFKNLAKKDNGELQRWFEERHKEMGGKCLHCSGLSSKGASQYKCSIAHILPKRLFKSVATHPLNWIELCFWGNSCHTNFDNYMLDITELNCFDLVVERFIAMYPSIDKKERRYIPGVLLEYVKNEIDL